MLHALLTGRKTQTRRIIKEQDLGTKSPSELPCPYGRPGDILWVKETFRREDAGIVWRADHPSRAGPWTSPLFLKRKESRIALRLVETAMQPLHAISTEDCRAEGIPPEWNGTPKAWFEAQWESVHGSGSWAFNPLIWVLQFELVS